MLGLHYVQRAMATHLIAAVERLTNRTVRTFLSGTDENGGSSIEAFVLDPPRLEDDQTRPDERDGRPAQ
jgi:hypothetical protein